MTCTDCKGRGRWAIPTIVGIDDITYEWKSCGTCRGTGESQSDEDADDFDIKGEDDE